MSRYQPYAEYKDSGVEWLGEVPEHWLITPTKRFFRLIACPAPKNNDYELLSIYTDIGVRPRKDLEQKGNKASTTDGYWLVKKGDIIVNKLLAWMGAIGYSEYEGVTSPAYDILRACKPIEPKFYHYLFRCPIAHFEFKRWSRGIMEMRLRLYFEELGRISQPFPPLPEQKKIAAFLDHETGKIDVLIQKQERLIELLKEKRQAAISHAVTKGLDPNVFMKDSGVEWLGEVPEHWVVKQSKFSLYLQRGHDLSSDSFINGPYPVYGSNGVIGFHNVFTTEGPSLTVGRSGSVGEVNYVHEHFWAHNTALYLKKSFGASIRFLFYLLKTMNVKSLSAGTAVGTLDRNNIHRQYISCPPIEEQKKIAEYLDHETSKIDGLITKVEQDIELMKERRTALISSAVTGKIDVRDWEGIPVEETVHG